jgi:hypothetical protein
VITDNEAAKAALAAAIEEIILAARDGDTGAITGAVNDAFEAGFDLGLAAISTQTETEVESYARGLRQGHFDKDCEQVAEQEMARTILKLYDENYAVEATELTQQLLQRLAARKGVAG